MRTIWRKGGKFNIISKTQCMCVVGDKAGMWDGPIMDTGV